MSSEDGPAIAYYLGQNPEAAERISKLAPVQAVYEIGRIASKPSPARPEAQSQTGSNPAGGRKEHQRREKSTVSR